MTTEADPKPDSRPLHIIISVLDELWLRAGMNNRGWKTLARALVLAHTGMRPSQMTRLDPDLHIRAYLDDALAMVEVPSGKGGKTHWKPLTTDGVAAFRLFLRVGAQGTFSTSSFYKSWMLACDSANVARFNPYKLRHSYATLLRRGRHRGHSGTAWPQVTEDDAALRDGGTREAGRRYATC